MTDANDPPKDVPKDAPKDVPQNVVVSYERFREQRDKRQAIAAERTRKAGERTIVGEVLAVSPAPTDPVVSPQPPRAEKEHAPKG
jgi:hypothetical protein